MRLRTSTRLLFLLAVMTACTTILRATAITGTMEISGSMPLVGVNVTENGTNLKTMTTVTGTDALTSGAGSGDFSVIPMMTSFGPFSVTDTTVPTGAGFMISNAGYGSFVATGGTITAETPNALVVDLTGTYTPGPLFPGLTAAPTDATIAFTQNGTSISASFTLVAHGTPIPEPATMVTMGMGLCGSALVLRRKLRRK